ncbi:MAG TPA: twin-arginine translocase TatA/TatE family subunit [Terriglobia bacterium]|nr:twin-arginine translocase TatA/TatE family subunit [Terriglobia bacterium]
MASPERPLACNANVSLPAVLAPGRLLDKQGGVPYYAKERYVLFSGGFTEVGFILFIAFLLFGPKKLPEIARILGKGMGELRRASNELKSSLEEEIRNLDRKDDEVSYSSHDYSEPEYSDHEYSSHEYSGHEYTEPETHPYTETEEEGFEQHPEETHQLTAGSEETTVSEPSEKTEAAPGGQPESDLEPAPEYGYDYSEPAQHEPEPRPRG